MSLAKLPIVTVIPGADAVTARPYSVTCPSAPPTPAPAPSSSGGLAGCYDVPVYGLVPKSAGDLTGGSGYQFAVVSYQQVCGA